MKNDISFKIKFALIISVTFWASAFVGIRAGLEGYSPGSLALFRFIVASICMFVIYQKFAARDFISVKDKLLLLLIGAAGIGSYNVALNYGELSVPSGIASFIISQSPIITSIFAIFFLSERLSFFTFLGMLISISGVMLITFGQTNGFHVDVGLGFILLATVVGSFYSILQKPFLKKYSAMDVSAYLIWGGTLVLLIYTPDLIREMPSASWNATLATIYLGIFPAAIAYVAWSYVLADIPASRAVSFLYFMPIIATLLGWLWLNEVPVMMSLVGGLIALFGVWVVNRAYVSS